MPMYCEVQFGEEYISLGAASGEVVLHLGIQHLA